MNDHFKRIRSKQNHKNEVHGDSKLTQLTILSFRYMPPVEINVLELTLNVTLNWKFRANKTTFLDSRLVSFYRILRKIYFGVSRNIPAYTWIWHWQEPFKSPVGSWKNSYWSCEEAYASKFKNSLTKADTSTTKIQKRIQDTFSWK